MATQLERAARALLFACEDVRPALQWEDPLKETGMTKQQRINQMLELVDKAIEQARTGE